MNTGRERNTGSANTKRNGQGMSAWSRQRRVSDQEDRSEVAVYHQQTRLETERVLKRREVQT